GLKDNRFAHKAVLRSIGDVLEADTADTVAVLLIGNNQSLLFGLPAGNSPLTSSQVGLVDLHFPPEPLSTRPDHCVRPCEENILRNRRSTTRRRFASQNAVRTEFRIDIDIMSCGL